MARRHRQSTMTSDEFRRLRLEANLSIARLAWLLDCKEQTLRNIEQGGQRPGKQMAHHLRLLSFPSVRQIAELLRRETGVTEPP